MADLNSVQSFSPSNFNVEPVVKRNQQQGGTTPLSMLEMANTARSLTALQKEQALLEPGIEQGKATSKKTQIEAFRSHFSTLVSQGADLLKKDNLTPEDISNRYTEINKNLPGGEDPKALSQVLSAMPSKNQNESNSAYQARLKGYVATNLTKGLENQAQFESAFPATQQIDTGGATATIASGNPLTAVIQPGSPTGPFAIKALAPQVVTNQITGAPTAFGGGVAPQFGGVGYKVPQGQPAQQAPITQPATQPANPPMVTQGGNQPSMPNPQAPAIKESADDQLKQLPNESPANFNARVAQVQNSFVKAQDQFNNTSSEFGHIPTIKNINNNIINLLKDPEVNTGSVQNFLSKKLGKENLSPKEQELAKYLGQRVQNLSPKSDADAANKKEAYGNLQMKKEALMDLVRQDQAWVTSQELQAKGVLKNGGSATSPNFGKVAKFNNQFTQFASDPNLMKYISIIGENPDKAELDASDIKDIQKEFGSMSLQKRQEMELKRKTLLRLVNGGK